MSEPEGPVDPDKLKVILSICQFLTHEIEDVSSSPDMQESLAVAIQCIEAAYCIDYDTLVRNTPHIQDLWQAVVIGPVDPQVYIDAETFKQKGNDLMSIGCFKEAAHSYTCAIQLNGRNAVYYCNRAAAYCRIQSYNASIADCKTAVKLDPKYSKAYGRLGLAYLSMNSLAEAMEAYSSALKLDPTNEMYKQNFEIAAERLRVDQARAGGSNSGSGPSRSTSSPPISSPTSQCVQSAISHIVQDPNLLNVASEMLNDAAVRNAMTGLIQMGGETTGSPSMENLLFMGQQLAQQMQEQHPNFMETLRRQFAPDPSPSPARGPNSNDKNQNPPGSGGNA